MGDGATVMMPSQAERLNHELTVLATAQLDTPEFGLFFETPLANAR